DALVCFDRLYCIANPAIDVSLFNERLGADVLAVIPDPDGGMLRRVAGHAAANGLAEMGWLRRHSRAGGDDAGGQEVQAVVEGWRAVLGPDLPNDGPFDVSRVDIRLARMTVPAVPPPPAATPLSGPGGFAGIFYRSPQLWRRLAEGRRRARGPMPEHPEL